MTTLRLTRAAAAVSACFVLAACGKGDDAPAAEPTPVVTTVRPASAGSAALGPGDIRILTADDGLDLALIGDSISGGLSPSALEKARRETDTSAVRGTGFGAYIERTVKGAVSGALGTRAAFPLSAVRDVRYENGAIRFDWVGTPPKLFEQTKVNGRPVLESFRPDDARRFVEAVRTRKAATIRE